MTESESNNRAEETFWLRWDQQVHAQSRLEQFERPDIARSYPLPVIQHGRMVLRHFYYRATLMGPNSLYLGPPRVCVGLDYETETLVEEFPASELGIALFEPVTYEVADTQMEAIRTRAGRLRALYDQVLLSYPHKPAGELGPEFKALLEDTVPPMLLPYYQALSPEYMLWLQP